MKLKYSQAGHRIARFSAHHFINVAFEEHKQAYCLACALLDKFDVYDVMDPIFLKLEELKRLDEILNGYSAWVASHGIHIFLIELDRGHHTLGLALINVSDICPHLR